MNQARLLYIVLLLWASLASVFAFTDLQISIQVVDPNTPWAQWLADYGEAPGRLVIITAIFLAAIVGRQRNLKNELLAYPFMVFTALCIMLITKTPKAYWLVAIGMIVITQALLYRFRPLTSAQWIGFVKVTLATFIVCLIFVNLGKDLWGRARFIELDTLYTQFTPWYLPQGYNDHKSFPSGHAAFAWILLPLYILVADKQKLVRSIVLTTIIVWGIAVAASRVRLGAHFASDVLFSSGFTIVSFLLFRGYFDTSSRNEAGIVDGKDFTAPRPDNN